jgi:asparagine synthase (glutamine-hydrolysing)
VALEAGGRVAVSAAGGAVRVAWLGRLFNRRDFTHAGGDSDAQLVLDAYEKHGASCVESLNGQFALAIADARRGVLLLARDHLGICPLHYSLTDDALVFASTAKGVLMRLGVQATLDEQSLLDVLLCGQLFDGRSMFTSVSQVEPGSILVATGASVASRRYWTIPAPRPAADDPSDADVEGVAALCEEAVRLRTHGHDDCGVLLSGGLDSSALTAWATRAGGGAVRTFTIDYSNPFNASETDAHYAGIVADRFGTAHQLSIASPEEYYAAFDPLAWHTERPFNKGVATMYLACRLAAPSVATVLSGEGMDEMLAGYAGSRGLGLEQETPGALDRFPWAPGCAAVAALLDGDIAERARPLEIVTTRLEESLIPVRDVDGMSQRLHLYTTGFLRDLVELHAAASAAAGLETRFPYLDYRLVETLAAMPSSWKLRDGVPKYVFRRAIAGLVPEEVLRRRKTHLPQPRDPASLARQLAFARELLLRPDSRASRFFDSTRLGAFLHERAADRSHDMLTVWQVSTTLITLELLFRHFRL